MESSRSERKTHRQEEAAKSEMDQRIKKLTAQIRTYDSKISAMGVETRDQEGLSLEHLQTMKSLWESQRQTVIDALENHTIKSTDAFIQSTQWEMLQQLVRQGERIATMQSQYSPAQVDSLIQGLTQQSETNRASHEKIQTYMASLKHTQVDSAQRQRQHAEFEESIANKMIQESSSLPIPFDLLVDMNSASPALSLSGSDRKDRS